MPILLQATERFNEICERVKAENAADHLDYRVLIPGLSLATATEDIFGNDVPTVHIGWNGVLRLSAVNDTHRRYILRIVTNAKNRLIRCGHLANYSAKSDCGPLSFRKRRAAVPTETYLKLSVAKCTVPAQENLISEVIVEDDRPNGVLVRRRPKELRNSVRIVLLPPNKDQIGDENPTLPGNQAMERNYLRAFAEGVKQLAGPLAAPLAALLVLYDDERKQAREAAITELIEKGNNDIGTALSDIFEVKAGLEETREVLLRVIEHILATQKTQDNDDSVISDSAKLSLPTERAVVKELTTLYARHLDMFESIVARSGFPIERVEHSKTPEVFFDNFVNACRGRSPKLLAETFANLLEDKPGSTSLRDLKDMYCEIDRARSEPNLLPESSQNGDI